MEKSHFLQKFLMGSAFVAITIWGMFNVLVVNSARLSAVDEAGAGDVCTESSETTTEDTSEETNADEDQTSTEATDETESDDTKDKTPCQDDEEQTEEPSDETPAPEESDDENSEDSDTEGDNPEGDEEPSEDDNNDPNDDLDEDNEPGEGDSEVNPGENEKPGENEGDSNPDENEDTDTPDDEKEPDDEKKPDDEQNSDEQEPAEQEPTETPEPEQEPAEEPKKEPVQTTDPAFEAEKPSMDVVTVVAETANKTVAAEAKPVVEDTEETIVNVVAMTTTKVDNELSEEAVPTTQIATTDNTSSTASDSDAGAVFDALDDPAVEEAHEEIKNEDGEQGSSPVAPLISAATVVMMAGGVTFLWVRKK